MPANTPAMPTIRMFLLGDFSSIALMLPSDTSTSLSQPHRQLRVSTLVVNDRRPGAEEQYDSGSHQAGPVTTWIKKRANYRGNIQSCACSPPTLGGEPFMDRCKLFTGHYQSPRLISSKAYHSLWWGPEAQKPRFREAFVWVLVHTRRRTLRVRRPAKPFSALPYLAWRSKSCDRRVLTRKQNSRIWN